MTARRPCKRPRFRAGLGMVEAMISLAIALALLTAVAAACTSAADAVNAGIGPPDPSPGG